MNILDIILIIPIVWLMYRGFQKGFIIELSSLVALILGIYFAINFSYFASNFLTRNFDIGDKYLAIFAFVFTFMVIVFVVFMIGKILEKFVDIILLGFVNKIAGAAFGIIKAVFLLSVILWIINSFDYSKSIIKENTKQKSLLYSPIEQFAPMIVPKLSLDQIRKFENPFIDKEELKIT
ncbi:MAG: colicin V production protein [Bacteroidetes bacterium HGW-Bacteroidetes-17]|jgi:membrane protein required for colicin V production|nr:MAG: colicin V production protein [Bacteroidetes bacterium HGW-Bacteroidetes-17]